MYKDKKNTKIKEKIKKEKIASNLQAHQLKSILAEKNDAISAQKFMWIAEFFEWIAWKNEKKTNKKDSMKMCKKFSVCN